ncbi:MAG: hypothetical protein CVU71_17870 [Deltaproteobacteria bacterium HGW-Deltaproteobacteria-6]|jgi:PAS domain S-box-containing protein|nr:MAG: hypothetical protein CVU71_17870 [Deltaproteobacteria bacterium HGW-Deltaproteobacteria-6]
MKHILIVDDNDENLYLLRMLLTGQGYTVEEAHNGSEALAQVRANVPDMVISDILMPEMDGFTFCRILKKDEQLRHIPFIFYTATYTDPRDEKLALNMGADAFIVKPTEPAEFLNRIEPVLMANRDGKSSLPREQNTEEVVLKEYNEALIRKLEHKMLKLEEVNSALEAEIASRKQAEFSLRESEERYRSLFENSMDGVLLTEPGGNILKANPAACRIFARSEAEICRIGRDGVVDASDPRLPKALEERERTGRFAGELTFLRKDGTKFPGEISSVIFRDAEGKLKTSMIIRDISGRKQAESQKEAALEEIRKLNEDLEKRIGERTAELRSTIAQLEDLNRVFVGRELKMMELKKRIAELEGKT